MIDQFLFQFCLAAGFCRTEKIKHIRIFEHLVYHIGIGRRLLIWNTRISLLHPFSMVFCTYHKRCAGSFKVSRMAILLRHGICATVRCTISRSFHASANARIYFRLRGENPPISGKDFFKSWDSLSMVFVKKSIKKLSEPHRTMKYGSAGLAYMGLKYDSILCN